MCEKLSKLPGGFRAGAWRSAAAVALVLGLQAAACAYTLVMRNGRLVEIPSSFEVTQNTLTYAVTPGLSVTVAMASIDIPATERANQEPPGAFLKRIGESAARGVTTRGSVAEGATTSESASPPRARRTVTDRDLEPLRKAREESERAYERRRKELGLPPVDEERKRAQEEALRAIDRESRASEAQAEAYWRSRAAELRTQMETVDGELDYLDTALPPAQEDYFTGGGLILGGGFSPFGLWKGWIPRRPLGAGFMRIRRRPPIIVGPGVHLNPGLRGRVFVAPSPHPVWAGRRRFSHFPGAFAGVGGLSYDGGSDGSELIARREELLAERAALRAQWRRLEEEARRAGALPGWLRP